MVRHSPGHAWGVPDVNDNNGNGFALWRDAIHWASRNAFLSDRRYRVERDPVSGLWTLTQTTIRLTKR